MKPAKTCIKIQTPQWHENLRKITQNLDPSSKLDLTFKTRTLMLQF